MPITALATINQRIYAVNHFLLFLEEEQPELSPDLSGFRLRSVKIPRDTFQDSIITNEDCETLQRNLKAEHHDFWYFIVRFLVTTGVRVSELVQIKAEHLACGYFPLISTPKAEDSRPHLHPGFPLSGGKSLV